MTTPYMGLDVPVPTVTVGPDYAQDVSGALDIIDGHSHTGGPGDGKQLPAAAFAIDGDVSWGSNDITDLRSTQYTNQSAVLADTGDVTCLYFKGGDLWVNNGSGTPVQVTQGSAVLVTSGNTIDSRQAVAGNITILNTDTFVFLSVSTAAARTITLPLASAVSSGRRYVVVDNTGSAATNAITIARAGADTINGATSYVIRSPRGGVVLWSDGVSAWNAISQWDGRLGNVTLGTAPARSGSVALSNAGQIKARNASDSADLPVLATGSGDSPGDAGNLVILGDPDLDSGTAGLAVDQATKNVGIFIDGVQTVMVDSFVTVSVPMKLDGNGTVASAGDIRLTSTAAGGVVFRNSTNDGDIAGVSIDGSDLLLIGDGGAGVRMRAGSSTKFALGAGGVGFYGHALAAQGTVTGSRSGATVAVLADLLTKLAATGLIVDGTSA